jgi:hypothetical protein
MAARQTLRRLFFASAGYGGPAHPHQGRTNA